jgi:hypothetical protein
MLTGSLAGPMPGVSLIDGIMPQTTAGVQKECVETI